MIVFGTEEKELAAEPYRAMCRALAEAFGARVAALSDESAVRGPGVDGAGSQGWSVTTNASAEVATCESAAADACAARVREGESRGSKPERLPRRVADPHVHVVAYQHPYGVDFSVHATLEGAYEATMSIVHRQCLRDERIRTRVERQFGHWVIDRLSYDEQDEIVTRWDRFAEGEAIWISTCDVEDNRHDAPIARTSSIGGVKACGTGGGVEVGEEGRRVDPPRTKRMGTSTDGARVESAAGPASPAPSIPSRLKSSSSSGSASVDSREARSSDSVGSPSGDSSISPSMVSPSMQSPSMRSASIGSTESTPTEPASPSMKASTGDSISSVDRPKHRGDARATPSTIDPLDAWKPRSERSVPDHAPAQPMLSVGVDIDRSRSPGKASRQGARRGIKR